MHLVIDGHDYDKDIVGDYDGDLVSEYEDDNDVVMMIVITAKRAKGNVFAIQLKGVCFQDSHLVLVMFQPINED